MFSFSRIEKQLFVHGFVLVPVGQLIAAAAQEAGRGALEQLDVQIVRQHGGKIHHALLQQTGNTVAHTVHDVGTAALAALEYACQTCIDDGGRAARLTNDCIFTHDDFSFLFFCFGFYKTCRCTKTDAEKGITGGCGAGCR